MARKTDSFPGLSASAVCSLTGVRPQTRETWVQRGLLRSSKKYGELDVMEQAVVKALLATLPKSQVDHVWHELRSRLRRVVHQNAVWVWDPEARVASEATGGDELHDAVVHGRPVYAIPVGRIAVEARRVYRAEVTAHERVDAARPKPAPGRTLRGTESR
jgi:hypothetical protein